MCKSDKHNFTNSTVPNEIGEIKQIVIFCTNCGIVATNQHEETTAFPTFCIDQTDEASVKDIETADNILRAIIDFAKEKGYKAC